MRWYKKLFGRQKEVKSLKKDESFDIYFQELEDKRWDNWIELEADRIFSEREEKRELATLIPDSPYKKFVDGSLDLYIPNLPPTLYYTVHHQPTAKYLNVNVYDKIQEKLNDLMQEEKNDEILKIELDLDEILKSLNEK